MARDSVQASCRRFDSVENVDFRHINHSNIRSACVNKVLVMKLGNDAMVRKIELQPAESALDEYFRES
jgi:hypothetical protein